MKVDLNKYDTIIFDFGGVILDINPELSVDEFRLIGKEQALSRIEKSDILWQFERGEINADTLHKEMCTHLDKQISMVEFTLAWNALLLDYKPDRIANIQKLAKTHKLILLSNTNEIHFAKFSKKLEDEYQVTFDDLFYKVYLSYEMGLIKPDIRIYQQVVDELQLVPEKTLFIEDTPKNAEAAKQIGIETLVIPRNGSFYNYFE